MRRLALPAIEVRRLERRFGPRPALSGVDLTVGAGQVHGLLGPAGAGKTTLLRVLAGLIPPSAGEAHVRGRVGLVSVDDGSAYHGISGLENLVFVGRLHGMTAPAATERGQRLLQQVGLGRAGHGPVGAWTPGMRVRLAFARALLTDPEVLLIDEPPAGIDPATGAAIRALVSSHARSGAAVIWATRRLDKLQGLAGGMTLLAGGRARYSGSVEALALRALAMSAEDVADRIERAA